MGKKLYFEAFRVQRMLMTLLGIWPRKDYGVWYKLYGFVMSFALPGILLTPNMILIFSKSTDPAKGAYLLFTSITTISYGVKLIVLYVKEHSFYEVLDDLEQPLFVSHHSCFDVYMKKAVWISVATRKLIHFPCIIFIVFVAVFPALDTSSTVRPLPFDMPINTNQLPFFLYVAVYCLQIVAAAVCASNNANMDTLVCSLMALGTAQLEMLRESLRIVAVTAKSGEIGSVDNDLDIYGKNDSSVARNIGKCVKHHIAISNYVQKLEGMFTYSFLVQFITSVIAICFAGFSFLVIPVSNILFEASLSYFVAAMVEISIYCLFGDELIIQSLKINDACYMSEWNNCGPEIRRSLFIIMENSKRPLVLTAGKFATLSRESLVTIFKSSASYFAVLRKLYGIEE